MRRDFQFQKSVFILSPDNEEGNADYFCCHFHDWGNSTRILWSKQKRASNFVKVSVTFGKGGTCDECITIKPTSGEPSELVGSYM